MKHFKHIKISLALLSMVFVVSSCSSSNSSISEKEEEIVEVNSVKNDLGYYEITQNVAKEMMDNEDVVILDVREEDEYKEGHIENSVLLPLGNVSMSAESVIPNKDEIILVYCRSGNRSKQASYVLADLGYTNVYEFGGINTWEYGTVK